MAQPGIEQQKLDQIRQAVAHGHFRYTVHAEQQRIARAILGLEIEQAIAQAEIIEDYPQHRYGPCCLIFGRTAAGGPAHRLLFARYCGYRYRLRA